MSSVHVVAPEVPSLPWEDRPVGCVDAFWRYSRNPIVTSAATPIANSVFNSAAIPFGDGFAGVFRVDDRGRQMRLHAGFSSDGVSWSIEPDPIRWRLSGQDVEPPEYGYDPRAVRIEDRYWITWCNGFHGPAIGIGFTEDFRSFTLLENALLPCNRNGVLFPRRVGGGYVLLSRPSDFGHTAFGEIFLSQSQDLVHWGRHRWVMGPQMPWESTKIGAGPAPIETSEGWLLFYHGVLTSCSGYVYHMGAALLDLERPWLVIARCPHYLLAPREDYERVGDVPNVVFPCAAIVDGATGRLALYYGAADTSTCLAFGRVDEIVRLVKEHPV